MKLSLGYTWRRKWEVWLSGEVGCSAKGTCGWWYVELVLGRSLEVGWGIGRGLCFFLKSSLYQDVEEESESQQS